MLDIEYAQGQVLIYDAIGGVSGTLNKWKGTVTMDKKYRMPLHHKTLFS